MIINRKKLSMVNNKTCMLICFIVSKLIVKHQEKFDLFKFTHKRTRLCLECCTEYVRGSSF